MRLKFVNKICFIERMKAELDDISSWLVGWLVGRSVGRSVGR